MGTAQTKQSDSEAVMIELRGIWSSSFPVYKNLKSAGRKGLRLFYYFIRVPLLSLPMLSLLITLYIYIYIPKSFKMVLDTSRYIYIYIYIYIGRRN